MAKMLYNFYIEERDKKEAIDKLNRIFGTKEKGQLASLLRVMLKQFISTPDEKINPNLLIMIEEEYVYSQTLNKRSKM